MSHLFYDTFGLEKRPLVYLCGDDSVEILQAALARELSGQGKTVLVCSEYPMAFPVEGQVLVDIGKDLLKQKIEADPAGIYYLCSAVKDNLLMPPERSFYRKLAQELPAKATLFCLSKNGSFCMAAEPGFAERSLFIHTFGYGSFEAYFNKFINQPEEQSRLSFNEAMKERWLEWAVQFCPHPQKHIKAIKSILFLNQVKSLIDENLVISIVRNLTDTYDLVSLGDITEYKLKGI